MTQNNTIVVCEYGWIICGIVDGESETVLNMTDSYIVRKWTNGKGIGALADESNKSEYTFDGMGDVAINKSKILFRIPCNW